MQLRDDDDDHDDNTHEPSAIEMFAEAAEAGDALSQFELGEALLRGEGVERDEALAVQWLRKAAASGHALAAHSLAECLEEGIGGARDADEAARWFSKAAEQEGTPSAAAKWKARFSGAAPTSQALAIAAVAEVPKPMRDGSASADVALVVRERVCGALLIAMSSLLFAAVSVLVRRLLDTGFSSAAVAFYNGAIRLVICATIVSLRGAPALRSAFCAGHNWRFVALCALRQASGVVSVLCAFAAYALIPIGDAASFIYASPVWTGLLASCWLREPLTCARLLSALCVCAGVVLVVRSSASASAAAGESGMSADALVGSALALVSSVALATMVVATRAIGRRQDAVSLTMWLGALLAASALLVVWWSGAPLVPRAANMFSWLELAGLALGALAANVCMNLGLQRLDAAPAAVISSLEVMFSYAFQLSLLNEPLRPSAIAGAAIIVACALGASYLGAARARPAMPMAERDSVRADAIAEL